MDVLYCRIAAGIAAGGKVSQTVAGGVVLVLF